MKSPIKAKLVTYNEGGREVARPVKLFCHFARAENPQLIEVILDDSHAHFTSVYIDLKSLMKEVKKHEAI